jgi:GTP cyclohydrolase I
MVKPSQHEAEEAIKTLLRYIGENPERPDLSKTPQRVIKSYDELFSGYGQNISKILSQNCHDIGEFSDIILLKNIYFTSMCEHHLLPIMGYASVGYIPNDKIVGISKLVRVVQAFAHRLQTQERMSRQIVDAIMQELAPKGAAIYVNAKHCCMNLRGVRQENNSMVTSLYRGIFKDDHNTKMQFLDLIK